METMEEIYRAHARTVYKFLLSLCHDPETAEELTQETFYQAVRSADRFDGSCKVSTWLCQIAKHLFYQHVIDRDGQLSLLRRIHALPEPGREVVYLRTFGGLSFREIGEVLGRTETWARVTFYRSKEQLKKRRGTR